MNKTINLNALRDEAYKTACEHGFHDTELSNEHSLCLVISELMEAVEADRKGKKFKGKYTFERKYNQYSAFVEEPKHFVCVFEKYIKDTTSDELADAVIRLLDLAGLRKIDVELNHAAIENSQEVCSDEIFTESIYNISIMPCRFEQNPAVPLSKYVPFMITAIFGLAAHLKIDIMWHIEQKMKYNKLRDKMHGKKY